MSVELKNASVVQDIFNLVCSPSKLGVEDERRGAWEWSKLILFFFMTVILLSIIIKNVAYHDIAPRAAAFEMNSVSFAIIQIFFMLCTLLNLSISIINWVILSISATYVPDAMRLISYLGMLYLFSHFCYVVGGQLGIQNRLRSIGVTVLGLAIAIGAIIGPIYASKWFGSARSNIIGEL